MNPKQRSLVTAILILGLILAIFFGLRLLSTFREFRERGAPSVFLTEAGPAETDVERIRDWMTIPFIAKMYNVPPPVLYEALGISPRGNQEKSLRQLNEEYFRGAPGLVEEKIKAAVLENMQLPRPTVPTIPVP